MNYITQNENNKCASVALCNLYIYYFGDISDKLKKSIVNRCAVLYNSNVFFDELDKACNMLGLESKVIKYSNTKKVKENLEKFCEQQQSVLMILISSEGVTHSFLVTDYCNNNFVTVGLLPNKNILHLEKEKFYKLMNKMKKQEPFMVIKLSQKDEIV